MQAIRFGPDHVLSVHDDASDSNRQFVYTISLTRNWSTVWGGQLQFLSENGRVLDSYVPTFNTVILYKVPSVHQVSRVAKFVPHPRASLAGLYFAANE